MGGVASSAKLGGHRPCERGDIKFKIFHVTSQDCVVKESCASMGGFRHHPVKSGDIDLLEDEKLSFQFDTRPCDHVIRVVRLHYGIRLTIS